MNNYNPVDIELIIMAGHYNNKVYDNRAIKKEFLSTIPERLVQIDALLSSLMLPTDFTNRENIKTIDQWVINDAEDNGVSLEANRKNSLLLKEKYIFKTRTDLPYEKERTLTYTWKSILYDLTLKLAEVKREQHPELTWKIQSTAKRFGSYKRLCLYGAPAIYDLTPYFDVFGNTSMLESDLIYSNPRILNESRNFVFTFDQIEKSLDKDYPHDPLMNLNRNKPSI